MAGNKTSDERTAEASFDQYAGRWFLIGATLEPAAAGAGMSGMFR
jgi:hypothetical protein